MNTKRETLRKTAAFISALTFLSSVHPELLNTAAVNFPGRFVSAVSSTDPSYTDPDSSAPATTSPVGTTVTTAAATSSVSTATTTTTAPPPAQETLYLGFNRYDIEDYIKSDIANQINKQLTNSFKAENISASVIVVNNNTALSVTYQATDKKEVFDIINSINVEKNNGDVLYDFTCNANPANINCKLYYKIDIRNDIIDNINIADASLKQSNNTDYVSENYKLTQDSFTLKNGYIYNGDFTETLVNGKIEINDSEIKVNNAKAASLKKTSVDITIKGTNVLIRDNSSFFPKNELTIKTTWLDLGSQRVNINTFGDNTKGLLFNDNKKVLNQNNYNGTLQEILQLTGQLDDKTVFADNAKIEVTVAAVPKTVKVLRKLGDDDNGTEINISITDKNTAEIPYIIIKNNTPYYLSDVTNKSGKNHEFEYSDIYKKLTSPNPTPNLSIDYWSELHNNDPEKADVTLVYKAAAQLDNSVRDDFMGLLCKGIEADNQKASGYISGDILIVPDQLQYSVPENENYPDKTFHFINNNGVLSTFSTDAEDGSSKIIVNPDTDFFKVLLINSVDTDGEVNSSAFTPFLVYIDRYAPETKILSAPEEWSVKNEFSVDFTVSDIDPDLNTSCDDLMEDLEYIQNIPDLDTIQYISVAGHKFNKPEGGWNNSETYTIKSADDALSPNDEYSKYNVTLEKKNDEDGNIYFTAHLSLNDSSIMGVNENIEIYAVDTCNNSGAEAGKSASATVKIDLGDPVVLSISAEAAGTDGYVKKNTDLVVKALCTDEYEKFPFSGISTITYRYCGMEITKNEHELNNEVRFDVRSSDYAGVLSVEVTDKAGRSAVYYFSSTSMDNVTDRESLATTVVVDNTPPRPAEITSAKADHIDNNNTPENPDDDKKWYKDYPEMTVVITDEGKNNSGVAVIEIAVNSVTKRLDAEQLTGENGFEDISLALSELAAEDSCYICFVPEKTDPTSFIPYLKDKNYPDVNIPLAEKAVSLNETGELSVTIGSVDRAGNESDKKDLKCYIDNSVPTVKGTFERGAKDGSEQTDDSIRMYKYGTFANHKINIKVPVSDGIGVPSSGYKNAVLNVTSPNGAAVSFESDRIENNCVIFTILEDLRKDSVFEGTMTMTITDNVGNTSVKKLLSSSADSSVLILENIAPSVSDTPAVNGEHQYIKNTENGAELWFSSDVDLMYTISDAESGVSKVHIKRSHQNPDASGDVDSDYTQFDTITKTAPHQISTVDGNDGRYDFHVYVEDNAGNYAEREYTVYKDTSVPYVSSIDFSRLVRNNDSELLTERMSEKYSHFHNGDYTATITVKDDLGASAGISLICCELINADGTVFRSYSFNENDFAPTGERDTYSVDFVVPEGFKGDIRAWTIDNVQHRSATASPNGFISENAAAHENAGYEHISVSMPPTDRRDTAGRPLYNNNVQAKIDITDNHSGISTVRWRTSDNENWSEIHVDANGSISGDSQGWTVVRDERNIVLSITRNITVSRDANDDFIQVMMTDNADNSSEYITRFSIDKQKPVITVSGIEKSDQITYYNTDKTVHVAVSERNFSSPVVNGTVENGFADDTSTDRNSDQFRHSKNITFNTDGSYTLNITDTDLAGNSSDEYSSGTFVIDKTRPVAEIQVRKSDGTVVKNGENTYISSDISVEVLVTEVNFDDKNVSITVNGTPFNPGRWGNGIVRTAVIPAGNFSKDGTYTIKVSGKDLAGNSMNDMSVSFTVDQKKPEINISGVTAANKDNVAPVIYISDSNLDAQSVKVSRNGVNLDATVENDGKRVKYALGDTGKFITASWLTETTDKGIIRKLVFDNFPEDEIFDGTYRIEASAEDMAENSGSGSIEFSVNRHGSVFTVHNADKINNKYLSAAPEIVITERNVDMHSADDDIIIIVDKGSNTVKLTNDMYTVSDPVQLDDMSGYEYTYTIRPEVFDQDLDYSISIQSVDQAGNKNVSTNRGAEIHFELDTHEPEFKCDDLIDRAEFRQSEREFRININEKIRHIKVTTSDGEVLLDEESENGENSYVFIVPASNTSRDLTIEITDLAGNKTVKTYKDLLITENVALYLMHKTWVKVTGASVIAAIGALIGFIFIRKRKKNRQ